MSLGPIGKTDHRHRRYRNGAERGRQLAVDVTCHQRRAQRRGRQHDVAGGERRSGASRDSPVAAVTRDAGDVNASPDAVAERFRQPAGNDAHPAVEGAQLRRANTLALAGDHRLQQAAVLALHLEHHRELRVDRERPAVAGRDPRHRGIDEHLRRLGADTATRRTRTPSPRRPAGGRVANGSHSSRSLPRPRLTRRTSAAATAGDWAPGTAARRAR